VARGKPTSMSSNFDDANTSDKGVDGNVNQRFVAGSCFHTGYDLYAWWQVDLTAIYGITRVVLYNRMFTVNGKMFSETKCYFSFSETVFYAKISFCPYINRTVTKTIE
jgi:hypothetical protein